MPLSITDSSPIFARVLQDEIRDWASKHGLEPSDARIDVAVLHGLDLYQGGGTLNECVRQAKRTLFG